MKWTREKPTEEGYYWLHSGGETRIVEVSCGDKSLLTWAIGSELPKRLEHVDGLWYGPITEPDGIAVHLVE